MSFKTFIERAEEKIDVNILPILEGHSGLVISTMNNMLIAIKNPSVDTALESILPKSVTAHIPQAETFLVNAITTVMDGSTIVGDINAAATPEAKVQVFIADMQKFGPELHSTLVMAVMKKFFGSIDNNALPSAVYSAFLEIKAANL
jgi:hypothetical protein